MIRKKVSKIINFIERYALQLSIIFIILSQTANAICDALKFKMIRNDAIVDSVKYMLLELDKYDNLWHWLKYGVDRPSLALFGFCSFIIIKQQAENDIWHYTKMFLIWVAGVIFSVFWWHIIYGLF